MPADYFQDHRGDYGTTRQAVEAFLAGADFAGTDRVTADLARSAADLVDAARIDQDPKLWLQSSTRLSQLLNRLDPGASTTSLDDGLQALLEAEPS